MNKPVLVVMAAGMGSRYGGLKQIDPVGNHGQLIIDYSIYDAKRAGFETVVFVIKHEIEDTFKAAIGDRLSKVIDVKYAFQELTDLPGDTIVSLNLWGLTRSFIDEAEARFPAFLDKTIAENPLKGEYFLPSVISALIEEGKARAKVLRSTDKWYGVTYQADKPVVVAAIAEKTAAGLYPDNLWEEN